MLEVRLGPGKFIVLVIGMATAVGCSTLPEDPERWPAYRIPVGSVFYLNRDITVYPPLLVGVGSVHFQDGRIVRDMAVDAYSDNCLWRMANSHPAPVLLESDAFVVDKVQFGRSYVDKDGLPVMLVSAEPLLLAQGNESGGPSFLSENSVTFSLSSDYQGDGFTLQCRSWDDYAFGQFLNVGSIRTVLGNFFTLQLASTDDQSAMSKRSDVPYALFDGRDIVSKL